MTNAFLHAETRRVDKSGCISFNGARYEVGLPYVARTVDVIYDPQSTNELTIEYQDDKPFSVKQLVMGERVSKRPELPEFLTRVKPATSRLLDAAEKRNVKRKEKQHSTAISFRDIKRDGEENV